MKKKFDSIGCHNPQIQKQKKKLKLNTFFGSNDKPFFKKSSTNLFPVKWL